MLFPNQYNTYIFWKKVDRNFFFHYIFLFAKNQLFFAGLETEGPNHLERLLQETLSTTTESNFYFLIYMYIYIF